MKIKYFVFIFFVCASILNSGCALSKSSEDALSREIGTTENTSDKVGKTTQKVIEPTNIWDSENLSINEEELLEQEIKAYIEGMTMEEKVAQLFIVLPESLIDNVSCVTAAGDSTKEAINEIPVGGFCISQ